MNRDKLEAASHAGIINQHQVEELLKFFESSGSELELAGSEEPLRFVRGFGDIFITLGILFVTMACAQISMPDIYFNVIPLLLAIVTTEWLVRIRRLALPGIALLVSTLYFASELLGLSMINYDLVNLLMLTSLAGLFYWRYRIPFTLLPIAIGCIAMMSIVVGIDMNQAQYVFTLYGLCVFSAAMWFDAHDVKRQHNDSDSAFWLHLLAAPLVVHGVMVSLLLSDQAMPFKEVWMVLFFIAFFLVALYVDRRAILVSSLSYAIYAVVAISSRNILDIENLTLMVFAGFGVFIVFFGTYWYKIRKALFARTSERSISRYVPPFLDK
ncbi:MAG: hypothetical protein R8K49_00200 [Mariprofundaceae bacterium]